MACNTEVTLLPHGPRLVCCWAPGSCCSGRAAASSPAVAAAETPGRHAPAAVASAAALTDAAPLAAYACTPEGTNTLPSCFCSPQLDMS